MKLHAVLQIIGAILLSVAALILFIPAGIALAGGLAMVFGVALEREGDPTPSTDEVAAEVLDDQAIIDKYGEV